MKKRTNRPQPNDWRLTRLTGEFVGPDGATITLSQGFDGVLGGGHPNGENAHMATELVGRFWESLIERMHDGR